MYLQGRSKHPRKPDSLNRHVRLIDTILEGDIQVAEDAMRDHARFGLDGMLLDLSIKDPETENLTLS